MRKKLKIILLMLLIFLAVENSLIYGQMKKIVEKDGLGIYFLFYSEGNGIEHNGVVIYLKNENQNPINYNFLLIFRAEQTESEHEVKGTLKAGERKTGSNDGLYFIPFPDKRSIAEVGVKNIKVEKITEGIK
jgi:hypothetical protein